MKCAELQNMSLVTATRDIHAQLLAYHQERLSKLEDKLDMIYGQIKVYEAIIDSQITAVKLSIKRIEKMIEGFKILVGDTL